MKKSGFTLVELLASIAILAFILVLIVPNVIGLYKNNKSKIFEAEEIEILDAAKLYIQDYYYRPINSDKKAEGLRHFVPFSDGTGRKYLCLSTIVNAGYLENETTINENGCNAIVVFSSNNLGVYSEGKTYMVCDSYSTEGLSSISNNNLQDFLNNCILEP